MKKPSKSGIIIHKALKGLSKMTKKLIKEVIQPRIMQLTPKELQNMLKRYERRYKMTSQAFNEKAKRGELEESDDFIDWMGLYELFLREKGE